MVAGWWPCCCSTTPGNVCDCPGNVDITVSGATAKQCSVADVNATFTSIGVASNSSSESYIGSYTCSSLASINTITWFPDKGYDDDTSSCSTSGSSTGAAVYLDTSGYIWLRILCRWTKSPGSTWYYYDYFKSTALLSSYTVGDTANFTHQAQVADGSAGGPYSDPGIANMPFDASTATVSMVFNGCCHLCDDSTPIEMQVVIAGVAADTGCTDCTEFNGTYVLEAIDSCQWRLCATFDPDPACSGTTVQSMRITMTNSRSLGTTTTEVSCQLFTSAGCTSGFVGQQVFQNTTSDSRINCEYSSTVISPSSTATFCDWSSATCTVTAL